MPVGDVGPGILSRCSYTSVAGARRTRLSPIISERAEFEASSSRGQSRFSVESRMRLRSVDISLPASTSVLT